jgi:site-specific DNA-methyltransferase (adenine-specific)
LKPYYEEAGIRIYHGDAREVIPELEPEYFDLLLTDPPYGMAFAGQGVKTARANVRADGVRQGVRVVRQVLFETARVLRSDAHLYLFCHWESWPDFYDAVSPFAPIKSALVWWKDRGGMGDTELEYARDYEVILFAASGRRALAGRRDGAVLEGFPPIPSAQRLHPTEKPVPLLTWVVSKSAPPEGTVLDPFMGSGTTLRAAKDMGRRAVGIEIEERYCEIAAKRLSQGVLQLEAPHA